MSSTAKIQHSIVTEPAKREKRHPIPGLLLWDSVDFGEERVRVLSENTPRTFAKP
jgi:hypothetical protein